MLKKSLKANEKSLSTLKSGKKPKSLAARTSPCDVRRYNGPKVCATLGVRPVVGVTLLYVKGLSVSPAVS